MNTNLVTSFPCPALSQSTLTRLSCGEERLRLLNVLLGEKDEVAIPIKKPEPEGFFRKLFHNKNAVEFWIWVSRTKDGDFSLMQSSGEHSHNRGIFPGRSVSLNSKGEVTFMLSQIIRMHIEFDKNDFFGKKNTPELTQKADRLTQYLFDALWRQQHGVIRGSK